jgi:hypothetical protein
MNLDSKELRINLEIIKKKKIKKFITEVIQENKENYQNSTKKSMNTRNSKAAQITGKGKLKKQPEVTRSTSLDRVDEESEEEVVTAKGKTQRNKRKPDTQSKALLVSTKSLSSLSQSNVANKAKTSRQTSQDFSANSSQSNPGALIINTDDEGISNTQAIDSTKSKIFFN